MTAISYREAAIPFQEDLWQLFTQLDPPSDQTCGASVASGSYPAPREEPSDMLRFDMLKDNDNVEALNETTLTNTNHELEQSCPCTSSLQCASCRRKKWNANLRSENKDLRATIEGIRQVVELNEETLQSMNEKNLASDAVMTKLQSFQDQLRVYLSVR